MNALSAAPLYLDYAASTPPAEEVVEAMLPWLHGWHANPNSEHWHGQRASAAVEEAREHIAALIDAQAHQVVFTSGATEANNLAVKGLLSGGTYCRLWYSPLEHKSIREPARALAAAGVDVQTLAVDRCGRLDAQALMLALKTADGTSGLVALSHANNEIGTIHPIEQLSQTVHAAGHYLHVDASQSAAWEPIDVERLGADLLCLSSHKLYGPCGIGALYVSDDVRVILQPQLHGGGQEGGLRAGTVPTFLVVGFGAAARMAAERQRRDRTQVGAVASAFEARLREAGVSFEILGDPNHRLPGLRSVRMPGIDAEDLLGILAPTLSASTGAACAAGELRASPVLRALGLDETAASEVVRLSFGRTTTLAQAVVAADQIAHAIDRIRARTA